MTSHFDLLVRASIVLGLALVAMPLLKERSAVARRLVLTVAFASVLVLPFLPSWHVDAPVVHEIAGRVMAEPSIAEAVGQVSPIASPGAARSIDWLALAWSLGAFVVAMRFGIGLVSVWRLLGRASAAPLAWEAAIARAERTTGLRATVRVSSEIEAPAVTGIVSPVVIVPESSVSWTDDRKLAVLLHELAHVAANDLRVQVLAAMACCLYWFNPLAWVAARRLRLERELAADEAVLRSGLRASTYAVDLLAIAGAAPVGAIAIGEKPLSKRIAAIVTERRPAAVGPKAAAALVVGAATIAVAVSCTTPSDAAPPPVSVPSTSDRDLQSIAERELERTLRESKASGGTILVMSPKGDVLAEAGGHADRPYVTGSTIKSFVLAAAIDEGVVSESDVFDCSRGERGGKVLHDASPLGHVALPEVLARSSNVGFAQIFDRLGGARLDRALRQFHFTTPSKLATAQPGDWDGALTAIGVTMNATPRQVALGYAALAAGGNGIVKPATAARVTSLLEGVVASERGTGTKARVAGARVAGKTGSSEWKAADGTTMTYASFVGYVPAEHPRYVIFVGIESPSVKEPWGGTVAAPAFSRVATQALGR